jgi:hypothetical protein
MSIQNLLAIEHPDQHEQPEITSAHQEAAENAKRLDSMTAAALYPTINSLPVRSEFRSKIGILAEQIDPEMRGFEEMPVFHQSLASSCYLTDKAFRIGAAAEEMIGEKRAEYSIVSVSSREWRFSPEQLENVSLVEIVDEVENAFKWLGINRNSGSLLASIHGYFDPLCRQFALSIFGLVDQPMAQTIERLRGFPNFDGRAHGGDQIIIRPLSDYARPLSTLVQTDWPAKISYLKNGKLQFIKFDGLISDPYLAPSLAWRDRWDLESSTVMIGLFVHNDKLRRFSDA